MEKTGIRNGNLFCFNCGASFDMHLPQPVSMTTAMMKQFSKDHRKCKKTWTEQDAPKEQTGLQRANWWIANGETGMSSKTMWNYFMGNRGFEINHPHDPDDFKRCHKLLQAVPEWRGRMDELRGLSHAWSNLVDNWGKLTKMYEQNVAEDWKNYKKVGMYEFMQELTQPKQNGN